MSTYEKYFGQFEKGLFASVSLGILVSSCVGGIAAMAILMNGNSLGQMLQLFVVVVGAVGFNGTILSQQPPRVIYNFLIGSLIVNTIIAVINFALH
ncbi:MAG: hypothetical protein EOO50_01445 [Flavobacterium sp.]|uniref:hypothetical protein n=1 Tax=Flavobacterium sp. TaxID=239 RepID=UPI00122B803D|nr:hypothetical protein [Flavobacterium sp.]RZJ68484.1 MAG: hypothetical protein EOO50_01445 [Flavobacterium sp.]